MTTCEIYLMLDEGGNYVAHHDETELADLYDNAIGEDSAVVRRIVKLSLTVQEPTTLEVSGAVQDGQEGPVKLEVASA